MPRRGWDEISPPPISASGRRRCGAPSVFDLTGFAQVYRGYLHPEQLLRRMKILLNENFAVEDFAVEDFA
jgi:hypothetical protein